MKRCISLLLAACLLFALTACKNEPKPDDTPETSQSTRPDEAPAAAIALTALLTPPNGGANLAAVAAAYEKATGTKVTLKTASASGYRDRLRTELDAANAPALFELPSPADYPDLADDCADLSKTSLYGFLADKSLAVTAGEGVYAIPYHVEAFGLLVNKDVTDRYFALTDRKTTFASLDEIDSFDKLKALVEDMQAHKTDLGITGVFAPMDPADEESARWLRRLSSLPLYYEFAADDDYDSPLLAALAADRVDFDYGDNLKEALALYRANTADSKKAAEAFAAGDCAMMPAGTDTAAKLPGGEVRMLPLYIGADGEDKTGLCVTDVHYLAVNARASESQRKSAVDFLEWLFSSDEGKRLCTETLGLTAPFGTFQPDEQPDDPVKQQTLAWLAKDGVTSVTAMDAAYRDGSLLDAMGTGMRTFLRTGDGWDDAMTAVRDWTRDAANDVRDAAENAADWVSDAADTARDKVSEAADTVSDKASEAADTVSDRVDDAADAARDRMDDMTRP